MHHVRELRRRNKFENGENDEFGISKCCYPVGPLDECEAQSRDLDRDISLDTVGVYVIAGSVGMNEVTQRRE